MKKVFLLLIVTAFLATLLTGCNSNTQVSTSNSQTASAGSTGSTTGSNGSSTGSSGSTTGSNGSTDGSSGSTTGSSGSTTGSSGSTSGSGGTTAATNVPVSLTMTDDPPSGVSVLFFQVSLTSASMQPESPSNVFLPPVSLLTAPIDVDVTQLQALSAFLDTANVPTGSYSGLSLTFASPKLVIQNNGDQAIASTCAIGSVCLLTPTLGSSATINLTSAPFPVTVAAGSPLGFLIDFRLNTIIQSDLSVNLGATDGITLAQLPPAAPSQPPAFGSITGTVATVDASQNQFTVQTPRGRTFTIDSNSSTTYNDFPPGPCATGVCNAIGSCTIANISCLAEGQIVQIQVASVESDGDLLAAQVTCVQAASQQTVIGTIISIPSLPLPTGETVIQLLIHGIYPSNTGIPVGGIANVALWQPGISGQTATTYSIDTYGFTIPSGNSFASSSDLAVGQTVQVDVVPGSLQPGPVATVINQNGWGPPQHLSFTTDSVQLQPSQFSGAIFNISSPEFSFGYELGPQCGTMPNGTTVCSMVVTMISHNAVTTSQTAYQGFTPDDFSGLAENQWVSVNGWLFSQNNVVAQTVTLHPGGAPIIVLQPTPAGEF